MAEDRIFVRDLRLRGIVGINDWEREKRQDIVVNLELYGDFRAAGASDSIDDALNYRTLAKDVIRYVEDSSHYLVEKLATVVNHHLTEEELTILNPAREEVATEVRDRLGAAFAKVRNAQLDDDCGRVDNVRQIVARADRAGLLSED